MSATANMPAIFDRVIKADNGKMSPDLARFVLTFDFPPEDHKRVAELSEKAQLGTLTPDEEAELDDYLLVNDLLIILQSKARMSLKSSPDRRIA